MFIIMYRYINNNKIALFFLKKYEQSVAKYVALFKARESKKGGGIM